MRRRAARVAISMATAASMVGVAGIPVISRAAEPPSHHSPVKAQNKEALHTFHQAMKQAQRSYQAGKVEAARTYAQTLSQTKSKTARHKAWEVRNRALKDLEHTLHTERGDARDKYHKTLNH